MQSPRGVPGWHQHLIVNGEGVAKPILANVRIVLRNDPAFSHSLGWDLLRGEAMATSELPWDTTIATPRPWDDRDDIMLTDWLQHQHLYVGTQVVADAVQAFAGEHAYHPVRDYLAGLQWDGEKRLDEWAIKYLCCADMPYSRAVASRWMISAVARIMQPGCKADCALVLEGRQGTRKSSALKLLGDPWFTDEIAAIGSKDAAEQAVGIWIIELAELDAVTRAADIAHVKAFMSRAIDRFRPSYGRRVNSYPRQCVFAATSNTDQWNRDETGGRRWWPLRCGVIDLDGLAAARDQLWAEARDRYLADESWWMDTAELNELAREEQEDRQVEDPWRESVVDALTAKLDISTAELMSALNIATERRDRQATMRLAAILRSLGWERRREGERGKRAWRFFRPEKE